MSRLIECTSPSSNQLVGWSLGQQNSKLVTIECIRTQWGQAMQS